MVGGGLLEAHRDEVHEPVGDSAVALVAVRVAEGVAEPIQSPLGRSKVKVVPLAQHHALQSQAGNLASEPERADFLRDRPGFKVREGYNVSPQKVELSVELQV